MESEEQLRHAKVKEFTVLFTKQKVQKNKTWHDGFLKYYLNNKIQLFDEQSKALLAEEFVKRNQAMEEGVQINISSYLIELGDLIREYERDLSGAFSKKPKADKSDIKPQHEFTTLAPSKSTSGAKQGGLTYVKREVSSPLRTSTVPNYRPVGLQKRKSLNHNETFSTPDIKQRSKTVDPIIKSEPQLRSTSIKSTETPSKSRQSNNIHTSTKTTNSIPIRAKSTPTSVKYALIGSPGTRLRSSRRTSVFSDIGIPTPKIKQRKSGDAEDSTPLKPGKKLTSGSSENSPEVLKRRLKKNKLMPKLMRLHGPPRPIEIPKKLLEQTSFETENSEETVAKKSEYTIKVEHSDLEDFFLLSEEESHHGSLSKSPDLPNTAEPIPERLKPPELLQNIEPPKNNPILLASAQTGNTNITEKKKLLSHIEVYASDSSQISENELSDDAEERKNLKHAQTPNNNLKARVKLLNPNLVDNTLSTQTRTYHYTPSPAQQAPSSEKDNEGSPSMSARKLGLKISRRMLVDSGNIHSRVCKENLEQG